MQFYQSMGKDCTTTLQH